MSNKTKFRFVYSDGSLAWAEVLRYDPSTRTVAVEITHTNKRNMKCVSHRDYACHTNARGVMYFDAFGTRFYSDGQVWGRGAFMNRRTYSLPRRVMNPLAFLAEVREKPLADKFAQAKVVIELEARVIDELVSLAKAGRVSFED